MVKQKQKHLINIEIKTKGFAVLLFIFVTILTRHSLDKYQIILPMRFVQHHYTCKICAYTIQYPIPFACLFLCTPQTREQ